jgi:hypothetical protein
MKFDRGMHIGLHLVFFGKKVWHKQDLGRVFFWVHNKELVVVWFFVVRPIKKHMANKLFAVRPK